MGKRRGAHIWDCVGAKRRVRLEMSSSLIDDKLVFYVVIYCVVSIYFTFLSFIFY